MKQKLGIIIGLAVAAFLVVATIFIIKSQPATPSVTADFPSKDQITTFADAINFDEYDVYSVIPADSNSGNLAEKVKGDPDTAQVVIYEFADYSCSHCAETNTELNRIYNDYKGQVAIVFRNYVLSFPYSIPAAMAANAASIQGYWENYKDILFSEQATWNRLPENKLEQYFVSTFEAASGGAGDTAQFIEDMYSSAAGKRLAFDHAAGGSIGVSSTPYLVIDGQRVSASELRTVIDAALND